MTGFWVLLKRQKTGFFWPCEGYKKLKQRSIYHMFFTIKFYYTSFINQQNYKGTSGGARFLNAAQIIKISSSLSFRESRIVLCKSLKPFILDIALSTWIQAFAIFELFMALCLENFPSSFKNGGITSLEHLFINKSIILNPLSAINVTPGLIFSIIPQVSVMYQYDAHAP